MFWPMSSLDWVWTEERKFLKLALMHALQGEILNPKDKVSSCSIAPFFFFFKTVSHGEAVVLRPR